MALKEGRGHILEMEEERNNQCLKNFQSLEKKLARSCTFWGRGKRNSSEKYSSLVKKEEVRCCSVWLSIAINCCPLRSHWAFCTACQACIFPWECSGLTHFKGCVHSRIPYKWRRQISVLKGALSQGMPLPQSPMAGYTCQATHFSRTLPPNWRAGHVEFPSSHTGHRRSDPTGHPWCSVSLVTGHLWTL